MEFTSIHILSSLCYTICMLIFLSCLSSQSTAMDFFTSCLIHHKVTNFTTLPASQPHSRASNYHHLLHFSLQNLRFTYPQYLKPSAIILPETKEQLSTSVICCRRAVLDIRVRCGGHDYEGLSSVSNHRTPFVIIDMMNLNRVTLDLKYETAWVEGGATLGELYHAIAESSPVHGFSGGSCPSVGVGGHFSGGGMGFLSRKYGLAADNVVDSILVDAKGRLLDREAMGEEVFWAIRGGGGGTWGIVFAWKIKLLRIPPVLTAFMVLKSGTKHGLARILHKWQYVAPHLEDEIFLSVTVGAGLPEARGDQTGVSAMLTGLFLGRKTQAISTLNQAFPELEIKKEDHVEMSWIESVVFFSGLGEGKTAGHLKDRSLPEKLHFKAKSDYVRTEIAVEGLMVILDKLEEEPKGHVIMDPYGGAMDRISSNALPFPYRRGNLFHIQYMVTWRDDECSNSKKYVEWIRQLYLLMAPFVSSDPRAAYVNYADLDLGTSYSLLVNGSSGDDTVERARAWGEKYFSGNYERLVRAKTSIDPNNIFHHEQSIPPLSSNLEGLSGYGWGVQKSCSPLIQSYNPVPYGLLFK
ncbi:hypothetical protein Ancab_033574 [Ancistrocladus abbreviatus]